jgi:ankyrin repeat protein
MALRSKFFPGAPLAAALLAAVLCPPAFAKSLSARLYEAARDGDAGSVQALLDQGADPNARHGGWMIPPFFYFASGETPLCAAARIGHADVASLLLKGGADREKTCLGDVAAPIVGLWIGHGYTPLLVALKKNNVEAVKALLAGSADQAIRDVVSQRAALGAWGITRSIGNVQTGTSFGLVFYFLPYWEVMDSASTLLAGLQKQGDFRATRAVLAAIGANPNASRNLWDKIAFGISNGDVDAVKWAAANSWQGQKPSPAGTAAAGSSDMESQVRQIEDKIVSDVDVPRFKRRPENPDAIAVVAGISRYQLPLPRAMYARRDAATVYRYLLRLGVKPSRVKLLLDDKATGGALKYALNRWLPDNAKPGSTVYFYFSGHGAPDVGSNSAYLVPWDGDPSDLKDTAVALADVYGRLGRLGAKHVLVALDSCFSGAGGRSVIVPGARPLVTRLTQALLPPGVTAMTAARGDQITQVDKAAGHGLFTYYFLRGLNEDMDDVRKLCAYVETKVADQSALAGVPQNPLCMGPDFVIK